MKTDYVKFEIWNVQEIFTEIGTYCYKHGAEQPILIHKDNERYSSFYGRRYVFEMLMAHFPYNITGGFPYVPQA